MNVTREHLPGLRLALDLADTVCSDSIAASELKRLIVEAELCEDEGCPHHGTDHICNPPHRDDAAVDRFAAAMKIKLAAAREKGRGGWDQPDRCHVETLAGMLVRHLRKGNAGTFEDVANFAMMLHQRGADPKVLAEAFTHFVRYEMDESQAQDARRYRLLREMTWHSSPLCVVTKPKESIKPGRFCPSGENLDEALDELLELQGAQL